VIRDISEQIEAEKELTNAKIKAEESDKLKSAFLSNMSHELRTPLNSICGFSDILKQSEILDEDQLNYVNIINTNSVQLLRLINDIVDISKIESGLNNVNKTKFNIIELIQEVANSYDELLAVKKLRLKTICNYDHEMSMVVSDYDKIKTIIGNILRNAIKFSNKGTIEIGIKFEELTYTIQIKDEGIGIDNKYLDVIFHRFRQGDIGSHMSRQGLGLGLSISKALIELLGGKIWVESSLGLGSTFYFTLPRTK